MHICFAPFAAALLVTCAPVGPPASLPGGAASVSGEGGSLAELHGRHRVAGLESRRFTHAQLWAVLGPIVDRSAASQREEIGRSAEGRPLYLVRYGNGPVPVLLWSQMHGDESTATMALADVLNMLGSVDDERSRQLADRLTVWMVPMLNPDGAERFQRRNAQGIDINRDARTLATPEGRALRELHRRLRPAFGFNLHDQNVRTPVGSSDRIAAIALLAPPFDEARSDNKVRLRAARVAATIRHAVEPLVGGHIARYDDSYGPRAFGDAMQRWGTSTVLIESGAWRDDPEKQYLRQVNSVALVAALDAIATGAYAGVDPSGYRGLPFNGRSVNDLVVRGGTVVAPGLAPFAADLAIDYADLLHRVGGRIIDVGDLADTRARDTLGVAGLYLHFTAAADTRNEAGAVEPLTP
ncbi:MAG: peptidase M14 [Gemmatimonadota bacterium]|nr:peptidase M14 [Gemmatimonadota bacterium]